MQASHLILFALSRPFEPFRIYVADGRTIDVNHPEMLLIAEHGLGLWLLYSGGEVEVVGAETITGLRTLGPVDPHQFMPATASE
jgi:hypothetical protein